MKQTIRICLSDPNSRDALELLTAGHQAMQSLFPEKRRVGPSLKTLSEDRIKLLLAYQNDAPAGCCAVSVERDYSELKKLFVAPEMRGHGVAELLVQSVEDVARAHRSQKVMLESGVWLAAAHRLYLRLGYKQRGAFGPHKNLPESLFFEKVLML